VTAILNSLVVHLLAWKPQDQSLLNSTYTKDCQNGLSKPSNERMLEILRQFICGFKDTYILTDALDECLEVEKTVLMLIETLHRWGLRQLHLLVTSRQEQRITELLTPMEPMAVDMTCKAVNDDIENYINDMLQSSPGLKEWGITEKDFIRTVLLEKANGM